MSDGNLFTEYQMRISRAYISAIFLTCWIASCGLANDWPMWRFDAGRSAAALSSKLPTQLQLEWTRTYSKRTPVWDDPLNHDLMQYDRTFEPIVKDGRMFIGFNDADKVVAIDVESGKEIWTYYTDGPVRFPAVAWKDTVVFVSDDGNLYCVAAASGDLRWKFQGAPAARKVIGNQRMISAWPARGAPVIHDDGRLYFAASIWPFMGTYIYCLDADSGEMVWLNDSTASNYIKQPHSAPAFAGVAPQGCMAVTGDYLMVAGGRSVPAAFDRNTGELRHFLFNEGGKGNGGSLVLAHGDHFYVHTRKREVRSFDLSSGNKTSFRTNEPVLSEGFIYSVEEKEEGEDDEKKKVTKLVAYPADMDHKEPKKATWEVTLEDAGAFGDIIQVGSQLFVATANKLWAVGLNADEKEPKINWSSETTDKIERLLAANGKLFAVTLEGKIMCYGDTKKPVVRFHQEKKTTSLDDIAEIDGLESTPDGLHGYVLTFGITDESILRGLLKKNKGKVVAVNRSKEETDRLRRRFDAEGIYGSRIAAHVGTIESFDAPPTVSKLVIVKDAGLTGQGIKTAYEYVRPYGGSLVVISKNAAAASRLAREAQLENAEMATDDGLVRIRRVGALPGAADWTHQYGNIANTVKSDDARVKLPLGVLWFGGSSNTDVLPRHGHGPPEQVVGGRLYIQGHSSLSCRDVYTGEVLWHRDFGDLGTYDIYFDETYKDTPLDPAYNQVHIPGANGRGTNFVATDDAVYIVEGANCHVLDIRTGKTKFKISIPADESDEESDEPNEEKMWAYIGIYEDVLLGGAGFANYRARRGISFEKADKGLKGNGKGYGSKSFDVMASVGLVGFDRHTGKKLWQVDSRHSFIHNGIVAGKGKVYCLDKLPKPVEDKLRRRGEVAPSTYRILALNVKTGEQVWETTGRIFGTWLGYSEEYDLLLHAGAKGSDRLKTEVGQGMAVYKGETGDLSWRVESREYSGPCIIHNDIILTNANSYQLSSGAYNLLDGKPKLVNNPVTNEPQELRLTRTYGCNNIIASENLLTFRSGAAGFYDIKTYSGTGNLGGFKSGCTSNLVVANGVLNAPDYTRTCSCSYQNQTSLALVHMPEMEMWTVNHIAHLSKPGERIKRLGINFGAPGDRVASDGTLWIDYPAVGGDSVDFELFISGETEYVRQNSLHFRGPGITWVGSSSLQNADTIKIPLKVNERPDEFRFPVVNSADDAEESEKGEVSLTSSDLELVEDGSTQTVGLRFEGVNLDKDIEIEQAYIQFTSDEKSEKKATLTLSVEDTDDAKPFTKKRKSISSRKRLAETVEWKPGKWDKTGRAGGTERSPNITKLVQKILRRKNWQPGNAISVLIDGEGKRVAEAWDGEATQSASLVVKIMPEIETPKPTAHTVRLHFSEPNDVGEGQRVFDIELQGNVVATDFDIVREAGAAKTTIVREFSGIMLSEELEIKFRRKKGLPIISGVEVFSDEKQIGANATEEDRIAG